MPFAQIRDIRMYYEQRGSGPRLLYISGTGGDLRAGRVFEGPLAEAFDLLAYDQRGLGQTDKPDVPYTMADYAEDAAALLDHVGWDRARVIGVSFGGMVSQELAARYPERVERLVLGLHVERRRGREFVSPARARRSVPGRGAGAAHRPLRRALRRHAAGAVACQLRRDHRPRRAEPRPRRRRSGQAHRGAPPARGPHGARHLRPPSSTDDAGARLRRALRRHRPRQESGGARLPHSRMPASSSTKVATSSCGKTSAPGPTPPPGCWRRNGLRKLARPRKSKEARRSYFLMRR